MGVERFVSNRGTPAIICSDNGTNLFRAVKELRNNIENWNTIIIAAKLAHKGIKWGFNFLHHPRYPSPHWHAINSGPLTLVNADLSDLGAITLNHFILGNQATSIPSIVGVDEFDHRKQYAQAQSHAHTIWARLIKEYVSALNRRSKGQTPAEQHFKTGD